MTTRSNAPASNAVGARIRANARPERRLKAPPWLKARQHTGKTGTQVRAATSLD